MNTSIKLLGILLVFLLNVNHSILAQNKTTKKENASEYNQIEEANQWTIFFKNRLRL